MKRNVCVILGIIVCCCLLLNLSQYSNEYENVTTSLDPKVYSCQQQPGNNDSYYNTAEEFFEDFSNKISKTVSVTENNGDSDFSSFCNNRMRENTICMPMINDKPIELRESEGYPAIVFSESEAYGQPWIWFFLNTEGSNSYIKIMYLDNLMSESEISKANIEGPELVVEQLVGKSTKEDVASVTSILNKRKTVLLKDRSINASEETFEDDTRIKVSFIYDDIMVEVCAESDILTDEWFSSLSFKSIELNV